jgi:hypothetical protein
MFPVVVSRSVCRGQALAVSRHYSRSVALKAEPKLHNATGKWEALKSTRPIDEGDQHVSLLFALFLFCQDSTFLS